MILGLPVIAGVCVLGAGIVLSAWSRTVLLAPLVQAAGLVVIGVAGMLVTIRGEVVGSPFTDGLGPAVGVDPLTGFFLVVLAVASAPALVYSRDYLRDEPNARGITAIGGVFALAMIGVLVTRDVLGFLFMWELMTMAPAIAILLHHRDRDASRTVLNYVGITHLAGVGVWVAMLGLAYLGAFSDPAALVSQPEWVRSLLAVAALIGFGTKAGLMPAHTWLPRAHPAAPSNVSAVMSGVMIKVAVYGLVRMLFFWLSPLPGWVAPVLLGLALLSCLGGVLYALMAHELKRLLAFHSVENIGIIALGLATALLAAGSGHREIAAIAFSAAMFHTLNHAVFKSLLFLGAGSFHRAVGDLDVDRLGGLLRRMPLTGVAFLVGAMAIAGVPPFNGFASEWLTFQGAIQLMLTGATSAVIAGGLATAGLAATAALAVFCFVKVSGLVLLGPPRQHAAAEASEASRWMTVPVLFLAGLCVVIGLLPGGIIGMLANVSPFGPVPGQTGTVIHLPHAGTFAPLYALLFGGVVAALLYQARRQNGVAETAPMWNCGQVMHPALEWTSAGFTKSLRLVLAGVLRPRRTVSIDRSAGAVSAVAHEAEVPQLFDDWLYRPLGSAGGAVSRRLLQIQSGSLRTYLAYLLITLGVVLALVRIGAG